VVGERHRAVLAAEGQEKSQCGRPRPTAPQGTDVEFGWTVMRTIPLRLALIAASVALIGTPRAAHAQDAGASEPSACVRATGPDSGAATTDSARAAAGSRAAADTAHTALRLFAAVQAAEVRFEKQPKICVTLRGDVQLDSVRVVGRRNLSSPVVRGTTYRDVYVAVEILGHLNAECISARITGARPAGSANAACASLGVRDSTAARRTGAPPP
jgi:hypothetical protein